MSSKPAHGEVYSIQLYLIKLVSDLRHVGVFFSGTPVSSTNETDRHDNNWNIVESDVKYHNRNRNQNVHKRIVTYLPTMALSVTPHFSSSKPFGQFFLPLQTRAWLIHLPSQEKYLSLQVSSGKWKNKRKEKNINRKQFLRSKLGN